MPKSNSSFSKKETVAVKDLIEQLRKDYKAEQVENLRLLKQAKKKLAKRGAK